MTRKRLVERRRVLYGLVVVGLGGTLAGCAFPGGEGEEEDDEEGGLGGEGEEEDD